METEFKILKSYLSPDNYCELLKRETELREALKAPYWARCRELFKELPEISSEQKISRDLKSAEIRIGEKNELDLPGLDELIKTILPWRKGPFDLFSRKIDAEWRSDFKWERVEKELGSLSGKRVLDIGCNNGYYMFRMLPSDPEMIVGIDPSERTCYQFELFQHFLKDPRLVYSMMGVDDITLFPAIFDVVLCMGILYHRKSPLDCLQMMRRTMTPGAEIIVENLAIPGEDPVALCVPGRYAKMRNVYFIPTASGLVAWLEKAGFVKAEIISLETTSVSEQRQTELAPYESLEDFLDPSDPSRTIEGHPAPMRVIVRAFNKG